jgi:hypothetical protein
MEETGGLTAIADLPSTPQAPVEPLPPNGAAPPRARRRKRPVLVGVAILAIVIGSAAVGANVVLSGTYSPQRAVVDYLHAQSRGDVNAMLQNGIFEGGEGAYHVFFTREALAAMMSNPRNTLISRVNVTSTRRLDSRTDIVTASLDWYGTQRSIEFRVVKDTSRMHWLVYPSWRVVAPTGTLNFTYPNQGGAITIDGVVLPDSSGSAIAVISGEHRASMAATDIVAGETHTVDVSLPSGAASVEFHDVLTPAASKAAADSVKQAFAGCDASKDEGCPGHRYSAPNDGSRYFLVAPDGSHAFYTHYVIDLVGDPTTTMQTVFESVDGQLSVSGSCTTRLTTDSRSFDHGGTFTGKLTWTGSSFDSHVTWTC